MRLLKLCLCLTASALTCACSLVGYPGTTTLQISGTVIDESGNPLSGATVAIVAMEYQDAERYVAYSTGRSETEGHYAVAFKHRSQHRLMLAPNLQRRGPHLICAACAPNTSVSYFRCDHPEKVVLYKARTTDAERKAMGWNALGEMLKWTATSSSHLDSLLSECRLTSNAKG